MWPVISSDDVSPFHTQPGNVLLWYLHPKSDCLLRSRTAGADGAHHTALGGICD
jgi:hypothetical protein